MAQIILLEEIIMRKEKLIKTNLLWIKVTRKEGMKWKLFQIYIKAIRKGKLSKYTLLDLSNQNQAHQIKMSIKLTRASLVSRYKGNQWIIIRYFKIKIILFHRRSTILRIKVHWKFQGQTTGRHSNLLITNRQTEVSCNPTMLPSIRGRPKGQPLQLNHLINRTLKK